MYSGISTFLLSHPGVDPLVVAFFFLVFFGFTLPIPEELALVIVGVTLRGAGRSYIPVAFVACLALILADLIYYSIARFFGPRLLRLRFIRGILKPERIEESERYFARKGPKIIFICRFVLGLRLAAIMSSGFLRLSVKRFLAYDFSALCIGTPVWLAVGYTVGLQFERGMGTIGKLLSICGPVAVVVAAFLVYKSVMADRSRMAASAEAALPE
jgi:membrane protein DedA with SNARE-associated domain